jgi:serine phosphatase RsbU (regulator of sigma subunit)
MHFAFIIAVPFTVGILHLLLYLFDRRSVQNLYVSVIAVSFCGIALADAGMVVPGKAQWILIPTMVLFTAAFVYSIFLSRQPIQLWLFAAAAVVVAVIGLIDPAWGFVPGRVLVLVIVLDTFRVGIVHWRRRARGSRLPAWGLMIFGVSGALDMLMDLGLMAPILGVTNPYLYGGSIMVLTMSVHLAQTHAITSRDLERQLVRVRELMDESIEHERAAREEEVRRRVVEADNERKTRELREARELQLAMLPRDLPRSPDWIVAASMEVATEVGGDYYDFRIDRSGGLTVAIGDAVGHGSRAGIIVAATKALFETIRDGEPVGELLRRFDDALRSMHLSRAHMCLLLARFADGRVEIANAGMPPPLLRKRDGRVTELELFGPPLGVRNPVPRDSRSFECSPEDLVLLMSDGLPEAGSTSRETMFGYESVRELLRGNNFRSPSHLVKALSSAVADHLQHAAPDDDITLVAVQAARRE